MTATGFDDLKNRRYLPRLVEWVNEHGATMPVAEVRRIRCARAQSLDAVGHGDYWAESLVSLVERMGLGRLVREPDGRVVVKFVEPLPSARALDAAWDRAFHKNASRG